MKKWLVYHKQSITSSGFDSVDWNSIERCLNNTPHLLHLWTTKHISGFCATNSCLHQREKSHSPLCPICKSPLSHETSRHLLHCPSPLWIPVWTDAINTLEAHLLSTKTDPSLIHLISTYLHQRGRRSMQFISSNSTLQDLSMSQDSIGWENFMEGKISHLFESQQQLYYNSISSM